MQQALDAPGIEYEIVKSRPRHGADRAHPPGQGPAIELEDGTWYWEDLDDMVLRISKGELIEAAHEPVPESEWEKPPEQSLEEQMALKEQMEAEATKLQNARGSEQWQG